MTTATTTTTTKGAHLYEIGFSYQREVDGELCDFTGEITTTLMDEVVSSCEKEVEESPTGMSHHEWDSYTAFVITEHGSSNGYNYDDMENITWENSRKIDGRTQEYREYWSAA
jgi:hypothetical protein